ncbi:MAG: ABC transporter permease [Gammaproteobacteria bacterium]|nr:ABC transporter permease [Gammaproteobacteria bacterium]MDD9822532.1 ABC transporter permease [Gammaproteobacteria bacterium]MDD9884646.1 ABC transporter permease [Gammaproteobacteria bacterium]
MFFFIARRLLQAVGVMLAVGLIAFALFQFVGDPVNNMTGQDTSLAEREALKEELGLNDSVFVQFGRFIGNAARGNFGHSYRQRRPVDELIWERFSATIELSAVSALLALLIGIPMGVYTALKRHSWLSRAFMTLSLIGVSLPTFLIGIFLILIFGVTLNWLPTFGRGEVVDVGGWTTGLLTLSGIKSLILPAVTLAVFQMTFIVRLVRAEMLEVLRADYIKFAHARGLAARAVNFGHALKNTLVPVITVIGLQIGSIVAFAIITESVFQWPGMGLLFIHAIHEVDIPVMAAYLMLIGLLFVIINLVVDILYYAIDPRLRLS